MAVHCNLSTLMGMRRYSIQDVHTLTGLSRSTVSSLYNDRATRIDFETLEKLCELFECNASDLFEVCAGNKDNNTIIQQNGSLV
jgi:putative transcriptional regulator